MLSFASGLSPRIRHSLSKASKTIFLSTSITNLACLLSRPYNFEETSEMATKHFEASVSWTVKHRLIEGKPK